jgi:hypothetical protein
MELVHSDVKVMPTMSREGAKYVLTLLDDFLKASYVECIRRKSDVPEVLRKRLLYLETVTGRATKMVRSDNGGEYTATSLRAVRRMCEKKKLCTLPRCLSAPSSSHAP